VKRFGVVVTSAQVNLRDTGVKLESWQHSTARDKIDGAKIQSGTITYDKLGSNEVYIRVLACQIEKKTGLDATSTGVKVASPRFKFSSKHVKQMILRSSIEAIPSDAVVRVGVYNVISGAYVFYRDYSGSAGEFEDVYTGTMPSDGDILEVRAEVTTPASAGTFDLGYASLMIDYGVS